MAVQRAMGAVPSSACPTLPGGSAAALPDTTWCMGQRVRWHPLARPRSRPAPTSRAAFPESRSVTGAPTVPTAPMSLTVSACPHPGRAGVLGTGQPAQSPQFGNGVLPASLLIYAHPSRRLGEGGDTGACSGTIRNVPRRRTETSLIHSCTPASAAQPQPVGSPWPPGAWRALRGTPQHRGGAGGCALQQ